MLFNICKFKIFIILVFICLSGHGDICLITVVDKLEIFNNRRAKIMPRWIGALLVGLLHGKPSRVNKMVCIRFINSQIHFTL